MMYRTIKHFFILNSKVLNTAFIDTAFIDINKKNSESALALLLRGATVHGTAFINDRVHADKGQGT